MVRTQIQLTEDQAQMLRELSLAGNESVAALIRKAIDRFLVTGTGIPNRAAQYRQALSLAGKYETAQPDIAVEHDRYLDEAFRS